jgi:peptidoglycan/xylan/chitin deacetylase (PgdA/CDA1 family)
MQVTILMYHMIADPEDPIESVLCRTPEAFRKDMMQIYQAGYQVLPLATILDAIAGKTDLPEKSVAITFDDGLACVYENALPILQEFGYPSSTFIVSGCVNGYNEWGKAFGLPRKRMLTSSEIRTLAESGVDIGAHTVNHIWLGKSKKDIATQEIRDSKAALEDILGQEVPTFAYPFGDWNQMARNAVIEAGYSGACSTMPGRNRKNADPYLLRRTEIKGGDAPWQFRMKLRFATHDMPPRPPVRSTLRKFLSTSR